MLRSIPILFTHKMVMAAISTFGIIIGSIVYRYHLVLGEHQNSHFEPIKLLIFVVVICYGLVSTEFSSLYVLFGLASRWHRASVGLPGSRV